MSPLSAPLPTTAWPPTTLSKHRGEGVVGGQANRVVPGAARPAVVTRMPCDCGWLALRRLCVTAVPVRTPKADRGPANRMRVQAPLYVRVQASTACRTDAISALSRLVRFEEGRQPAEQALQMFPRALVLAIETFRADGNAIPRGAGCPTGLAR